ncbi:MAG: FG-GAP repeat protein, partial [Candidatus Competibacter sp.]|nr:FG-GAP repeat protein [Candidatus Competibacter sp.]
MNRHRSQSFLIHLLALGLLVFFGLAGVSRAADPAPADSPPAARRTTLADLPPAAQYTVSAQFGRDDPAYHVDGSAPTPQANNPRQGLSASLSPTALQVRAGEIDWNLTLTGWGRDGALMRPALNPAPVQQANRVEYTNGDLTAWYVNGPLGLQQGWTVRERPAGEGELTLTLRSQGLAAQADADGRSLTLNDDHGMTHLRYAGLLAFDANGRELPARFVVEGEQVRLAVNDAGATYPLTIDPWVQVAKLATVADVGGGELGSAVAVSADGGTLVAGAPYNDTGGSNRGAVYMFVRPAGGWAGATETAKLTASDGANNDGLGITVAISADGSVVIASARGNDAGGSNRGAAYVFVRPAGGWADATETAKLTASDGADDDFLGSSVAISADGGTVVAGEHSNASYRGAAYVFVRPAGGWATATETAKLTASDGASFEYLGTAVAVSADGGVIVAGATYNASRGAAYVFVRPAGGWATATETAKLTANIGPNFDQLGSAVAVSGDGGTVIAGA